VKLKGSSEDIISRFEHCLACQNMLCWCVFIKARLREIIVLYVCIDVCRALLDLRSEFDNPTHRACPRGRLACSLLQIGMHKEKLKGRE
jgi:hypothetical protein